jgi:hypothetical protein
MASILYSFEDKGMGKPRECHDKCVHKKTKKALDWWAGGLRVCVCVLGGGQEGAAARHVDSTAS